MSFQLIIDDQFLKKHLDHLLKQRPHLNLLINNKNMFMINIIVNKKKLEISGAHFNKFDINTPIHFYEINKSIELVTSSYKVNFKDFFYVPYLNKLFIESQTLLLNEIHNKILANLIFNSDEGVSKIKLYEFLWPKDKEVSINKLDTHLTNLKNLVIEKFDFSINFKSIKNYLYLN